MVTTKSLVLLPIFVGLSVQLPRPENANTLQRRRYDTTQFGSSLKRTAVANPLGSANIIDNMRKKYLFPIQIGESTLDVELDTGSSDTWVIQTGYKCFHTYDESTGFTTSEAETYCNFGSTYSPGEEFTVVDGLLQLTCYGNGNEDTLRCVEGPFGYADVNLAGLIVPQQLIAAPNRSSYNAQGLAEQSGIMGLAFPNLTSAINTATLEYEEYSPIVNTLFSLDTFDPPLAKVFSISLSRDNSANGNGGVLTFGGLPDFTDPTINASDSFTTAPWQFVASRSETEYTFYSILIDSLVVGDSTYDPDLQIIVDSGANVFEAPDATVELINSYWDPPMDSKGYIDCAAVLTEPLGVTIGGETYYIDSADLVDVDLESGLCYSLVTTTTADFYSISDPLLKNVVAVYDWEDQVMAFYPRPIYES